MGLRLSWLKSALDQFPSWNAVLGSIACQSLLPQTRRRFIEASLNSFLDQTSSFSKTEFQEFTFETTLPLSPEDILSTLPNDCWLKDNIISFFLWRLFKENQVRLGTKPGHGIVCILSTVWIDFLCSRDAAREEGFLRKLLGMTGPMRLSEMPAFAILPFNFGGVHWVLGVYSFEERELHLGEGLHGKRTLSIDTLLKISIIASKMDRFHSIVLYHTDTEPPHCG